MSSGGWVTVPGPHGCGVHVHTQERDGRLVITGLYVHGPEVTAGVIRELRLGRVVARLNTTTVGGGVGDGREPSLVELRARTYPVVCEEPVGVRPVRERLTRPDGQRPEVFYARGRGGVCGVGGVGAGPGEGVGG